MWRLGAGDILELPLLANSEVETAPMAGKTWHNPAVSPHAPEKTGTCHTDTQWKAEGGEGREQKQPKARGIPCKYKCTKTTDNKWPPLLLVVYLVKLCLTS